MKYKMISKVIAGAGLAIGHFSAVASDFGGGWARDPHTGTSYNTNAPTVEKQNHGSSENHTAGDKNYFGGGWARDPHTGTSYYSNAPTVEQQKYAASQKRSGG